MWRSFVAAFLLATVSACASQVTPTYGPKTAAEATRDVVTIAATVGASSGTVDGERLRSFLQLFNQSSTATIYCLFGTASAVAAPTAGQITLSPLGSVSWTFGLVPSNAIQCIASASSTPLTILE